MKNYTQNKIVNFALEPEAFYAIDNKYQRIVSVLGGSGAIKKTISNELDLIEITRKGLPKGVIYTLSKLLGISMEKMSGILHVSHRTIQRKDDNELLNVYTTEQIIEIAEVISRGIAVLGTLEVLTSWLQSEIRHLNYQKPIDFLDTSFGATMVKDILGRIEHGVYS